MLTKRWGIFWRRFHFAQERWSLVTVVAMKLHNVCMDRLVDIPHMRYQDDVARGDRWLVITNDLENEANTLRERASGDLCRCITEELERRGVNRPAFAAVNSRA